MSRGYHPKTKTEQALWDTLENQYRLPKPDETAALYKDRKYQATFKKFRARTAGDPKVPLGKPRRVPKPEETVITLAVPDFDNPKSVLKWISKILQESIEGLRTTEDLNNLRLYCKDLAEIQFKKLDRPDGMVNDKPITVVLGYTSAEEHEGEPWEPSN